MSGEEPSSKITLMPWPVTHILLAEKIYTTLSEHQDKPAFLIGTCFPDIRYPAKIERSRTHLKGVTISRIQGESPFVAGLLFHSLVDDIWNTWVRYEGDGLFKEIPHDRAMFHTMKILQDKYLYSGINDWGRIATYFKTFYPQEFTFGVNELLVQRWHDVMGNYLSKPPEESDLKMLAVSLPADLLQEIEQYYEIYLEHPLLTKFLASFPKVALDQLLSD